MVGICPYPIKEEDFNYFKSCGHQIFEIIEIGSSVDPSPPNPGISIIEIIEMALLITLVVVVVRSGINVSAVVGLVL